MLGSKEVIQMSHSQDPSRNVSHLSKAVWDETIIAEITRSIISNRKGVSVITINIAVFKEK